MDKIYKQIPMSELRVKLPKLRRQVQLGKMRIVCTHYSEVAAFLLPLDDLGPLTSETEELDDHEYIIKNTEEMPLTQFRDQLTQAWEKLLSGTDCIYLTFHNRRVVGFVSPRFANHLSLPLIGDPDQLVFLPSEIHI